MYLKSIFLQGFKTFAGRTTLDLRPGITAIVGPNGSGKSNIADAVRWALGETNLRHVRCRSTDELIFTGNARRSSLGLAEVSLVFTNDGEWLTLPFSEVRVTRRAYRSGENEYLLNGTRVRLRDIVDLLAGASIHAGGHVVVGQGLVDSVLSLRAEERRPLIENLAGLKQYYLRRDDAEDKLRQTDENLVHVDALIDELTPRLENLSIQAEVLRAYRSAEHELHQLQQATYGAQAARVLAKLAQVKTRATETAAALDAARLDADRLRAADDNLQATLSADRASRESLLGRVRAQQATVTTIQREKDVAAAQAQAAEEREQYSRAEQARLLATVERERQTLVEARTGLSAAQAETAVVESRLAESRGATEALARERDRAAVADRKAQAWSQDASRTASRLAEAVAASGASVESLARELERHQIDTASAEAALHEAELALAAAERARADHETTRAVAQEGERTARLALESLRRDLGVAQNAHRDALREREQVAAKHGIVDSWLQSLDAFDTPVRALAEQAGALGIVAHTLRIDPAWQIPIAALLGSRYESVLTDDVEALIVSALDGAAPKGRVRIVLSPQRTAVLAGDGAWSGARPAESQARLDPRAALEALQSQGILTTGEVFGWACDVCEDRGSLPVCRALQLDRVLLLRDVDALLHCHTQLTAVALAAVVARQPLAVSLDGSILCGIDRHASETINRREDLARLALALHTAATQEETLHQTLTDLQAQVLHAEEVLERARKALNAAEATLGRARDEARFHERLLLQARRATSSAAPVITRLTGELHERRTRFAAEQTKLAQARDEVERARTAHEASQAALGQAQQRLSTATASRRDDELAAARLRDRLSSAKRQLEDQQRRVAGLDADLMRLQDRAQAAVAAIADLAVAREAATARDEEARRVLDLLNGELQPLEMRVRDEEVRFQALRVASHTASERLAAAQAAHGTAQRDLDAALRDVEVLRAQVSAELHCALEDLPDVAPPYGAVSRVRALRAEIASLGPVNARALEDLDVAQERLSFLETQSTDLRDGVARLRAIIEEANTTVRQRFTTTVEQLDRYFGEYFERLFNGGSCRLIAEYDALGLPTGVEVHAQPPGKRTRDLALLSGGERALIAMALLFAMLRVRPVPFCLLDEVEAALDEANTGRFGAILKELGVTTQFLVVTHNRGTMLHADCLYGITMSETGVSTAASLEMAVAPNHHISADSGDTLLD